MKKNLLLTSVVILLMAVMTVFVSAETYGDLTYTVSNGKVTITDCSSSATRVTIPSTIDGYPVTSIGDSAFESCSSLKSITIPNSVTSIGGAAFCDCSSLTSITIPNSVTSIGDYAFSGCSSLTSITIPDSVTSIGDWAFYNTAYYNKSGNWKNGVLYISNHLINAEISISGSYAIKAGTKTIADYAFSYCSDLTSITIPNSVTSIGNYAFRDCSGLTSITIPDSVTSIGDWAFYNTAYYNKSGNWKNGVLYISNHLIIAEISISGSYAIKAGTKTIADCAFYKCSNLTSIAIPNSVTSIGYSAFKSCSSLKSITIPNSVTSIGGAAFYKCSSLTSIAIPNSVTSIGDYAFDYCSSLTSINIPDSVTSIGYSAFDNCSKLTSVTIPDSVTSIGDYAFYKCSSLTSVTIPDSVTSIGVYAFYGCKNLTIYGVKGSTAETYAQNNNIPFSELQYVITYNTNGGTEAPSSQTKTHNTDLELSTTIPLKKGYHFLGWSTSTNGEVVYQPGDTYYDNTNITLYAVWSAPLNGNCGDNLIYYLDPDGVLTITGSGDMYDECFVTLSKYITEIVIPDSITSIGKNAFGNSTATIYFDGSKNYWDSLTDKYTATCKYSKDYLKFDDKTAVNVGKSFTQNIYLFVPDENVEYLLTTIKYPSYLTIEDVVTKDFVDTFIDSEYTDGDFKFASIISQYSYDGEYPTVHKLSNPFEIVFSVSEACPLGVYTLSFGEDTCVLGAEDFYPELVATEISIKDDISIFGDDIISKSAQYEARGGAGVVAVNWSVDNENIATINENGVLTPKNNGTVTITAVSKEIESIYATKTVTVEGNNVTSIEIVGAETVCDGAKYSAVIYPETAAWKDVVWSVDTTAATVTADGVLTVSEAGEITLRATVNDESGFFAEKKISVPSLNTTIEELSSDIGNWDKTFAPRIRNYIITVPSDTTAISLTGSFTGGSLKCGTTSILNGRARTISIDNDVTVLTLIRSNVSGKNDSTYTITVVKEGTTNIQADCAIVGNNYTFKTDIGALPENVTSATVTLALYDVDGRLIEMKTASVNTEDTSAEFSTPYDNNIYSYNVMAFEDLENLNCICENFLSELE